MMLKKGIFNPLSFVAKLISKIKKIEFSKIILDRDFEIDDKLLLLLNKIIIEDYPVEYITKSAEFMDFELYVDENVLIPRIETEDLVKIAMKIIEKNKYKNILDLGTGSGAIAIALKKSFPEINIYASDISEKALKVAKKNADKINVKIEFFESDIFYNIPEEVLKKVDFIVSNPPYVEEKFYINSNSLKYEPENALVAGKDGQDFFLRLSNEFPDLLFEKHYLFETTEFNIEKTKEILSEFGIIKIYRDSFEINRFVEKLKK
ncbi:hypothetical protein XO10_09560 [Marinitoga sp. 1135]|nr:hypothetical protein [Marinitoga sp. 1135]NUU98449.1 hypothetical protein [Marinitoga sp. 1138]